MRSSTHVLVIEGDSGSNPGVASMVVTLGSLSLGNNGLLLIVGPGHPYSPSPGTTIVTDNQLGGVSGALGNGSISLLLVNSPSAIPEGFGARVEELVNAEIAADRPIAVAFLPRDTAVMDEDLIRTKVNLIPESVKEIRVIDIVGLD